MANFEERSGIFFLVWSFLFLLIWAIVGNIIANFLPDSLVGFICQKNCYYYLTTSCLFTGMGYLLLKTFLMQISRNRQKVGKGFTRTLKSYKYVYRALIASLLLGAVPEELPEQYRLIAFAIYLIVVYVYIHNRCSKIIITQRFVPKGFQDHFGSNDEVPKRVEKRYIIIPALLPVFIVGLNLFGQGLFLND